MQTVARHTRTDVALGRVLRCLQSGAAIGADLCDFARRQHELTIDQGCILWGARVVLPEALRRSVLSELHHAHPDISRMCALARSYVWWPNIDKDLEAIVKTCRTCQLNQADPPKALVQPWPFPTEPWDRLHISQDQWTAGLTWLWLTRTPSGRKCSSCAALMQQPRSPACVKFSLALAFQGLWYGTTAPIHISRVRRVRQGQRHSTHLLGSVPPSDQWTG